MDGNIVKDFPVGNDPSNVDGKHQSSGVIPLNLHNCSEVKSGMFWYSDDTVSGELIPDKDLKSIVLFVKRGWVVGDTFEQQKLPWNKAMDYVNTFANSFVVSGEAYKIPFDELLFVYDNVVNINNALEKVGKPLWDKKYWSATSYEVLELLKFNKPVAWTVSFKRKKFVQTDINEEQYVRPLIRFKL